MQQRSADAIARPLGAYSRVDHSDLVAMHAAIAEVGVLYATAQVHDGWSDVRSNGIIKLSDTIIGGHAFAIGSYDSDGFWLQNSWGEQWGDGGFGKISYADWRHNGTDVWVAGSACRSTWTARRCARPRCCRAAAPARWTKSMRTNCVRT